LRAAGALEEVGAFAEIVGREHVLTDPELVASYVVDWTGRYQGHSPAVVRPGSVDEVAGLVGLCAAHEVALTVQGGNTGLVGGSVPLCGEVVLSLRRLDFIGAVDGTSGQVTVGCGVTIGQLQSELERTGWAYGVDLASRDSASIGGTIATNAGGLRVLRYGDTRAQVKGVEAVLGDHPGVAQVAVVGVPDDRMGEVGCAFVVAGEGHDAPEAELVGWARERLANFKVPRHVVVVPSLPVNAGGKVLKRELRDRFAAAGSPG